MPPDDIRLVARQPCEPCGGTGQQVSEDWQGFEAWADRRRMDDQARDFAVEDYFLTVMHMDSVPAQKQPCTVCDGCGHAECEVGLTEVVALVAAHIETPIVPAGELDELVANLKKSMTGAALRSQGLADPLDAGSWLRTCQEAAEALRTVAELRPKRALA